MESSTVNIAVGWALVLGGTTAAVLYYQCLPIGNLRKQQPRAQRAQPPARKEKDTKLDKKAKNLARAAKKAKDDVSAAVTRTPPPKVTSDTDGADDSEFARELSRAQSGTKLGSKKKDVVKQKSVKQSRAEQSETTAAESSTAGIDGDDDQSPNTSPELAPADAGDVSDMLEKAGPAPQVLRLTNTAEKANKKKSTPKAEEPAETKKQRQNRAKAAAAKEAREAEEAERKQREEQQRRLARISEGRPAQDGSAFMAAKAAGNAWTGRSRGEAQPEGKVVVQPLDTTDRPTNNGASAANSQKSTTSVSTESSWVETKLTEEEQMSLVRDQSGWNTVESKGARRNKKKGATSAKNTDSDRSVGKPDSVDNAPAKRDEKPAKKAAPAKPAEAAKPKVNGTSKPIATQSAYAALTPKEDEVVEWEL